MHRLLIAVLSLFLLIPSVQAADKPNLVLLPIDVSEQDVELETEYGAALQEGLQKRYTVYYGAAVEKQLEKEYSKIDCDAETCNQNLAIAFNGELIADGAVKVAKGGYLLKLVIRNVITGEVVETRTQTCRDCDSLNVIDRLRTLGRSQSNASGSSTSDIQVDHAASSEGAGNGLSGQRAILIFDTTPTGATIKLDGKSIGKTPYQGLKHKIGEDVSFELIYSGYEAAKLSVQLKQAITQLQPIELKQGVGNILIASDPYRPDAVVYINGEAKGVAPLQHILPAGEYVIQVKTQDKETVAKNISIKAGDEGQYILAFVSTSKPTALKITKIEAQLMEAQLNGEDVQIQFARMKNVALDLSSFKVLETEINLNQAMLKELKVQFDGFKKGAVSELKIKTELKAYMDDVKNLGAAYDEAAKQLMKGI